MSLAARVTTLAVAFVVVVAGIVFVVVHIILAAPPVENYTPYASNGQVNVVLQTDAQATVTNKPAWVTYFIQNPQTKQWVHTTYFAVPANTRVNITIYEYDGCTPLRNPYWGLVTGTLGNTEDVNGKPVTAINSWSGCNVGHTFSIPGINLNVPMATPGLIQSVKPGLCGTSPCQPGDPKTSPYRVMTFSFMTPHATGVYFWQCRVPCGGGFVTGFGGPMQTIGFMTGNMDVVS